MDPAQAGVSDRDLLRVTHDAAARLRVERDPYRLQACLSFLDRLSRYDGYAPLAYPDETSPQRAALADFAFDAAQDRDWMWRWASEALIRCGFNPVAVVVEGAVLRGSTDYGHAVASFDPNPNNYQFLDVDDLPQPHTLHSCAHVREDERRHKQTQERQGRIAKLLRPIPNASPEQRAMQIQRRVIDGDLPPCAAHRNVTDWDTINRHAANIRNTVRPWNAANVVAAVQAASLSFDEQIALQTLFLDPITWDGKDTQVANGQHRICGLRSAGTHRALVNLI